jgi:SAM-dependent methyltransferase
LPVTALSAARGMRYSSTGEQAFKCFEWRKGCSIRDGTAGRPFQEEPQMADESQGSLALSVLKRAHGKAVFERRVRVLAESLAARIPSHASVLDIGCGDGTIASLIQIRNPTVTIQGIEFAPRPTCQIECKTFDGKQIPHPAGSFDVCMFVDVLHHTQEIETLLSEACRVSRQFVLLKDHLAENRLDFATLQLMDWVGNRPHGVDLPYNYQNRAQWDRHFSAVGLKVREWQDRVPLYPFPFSAIFGRKLHFVAVLEKTKP